MQGADGPTEKHSIIHLPDRAIFIYNLNPSIRKLAGVIPYSKSPCTKAGTFA